MSEFHPANAPPPADLVERFIRTVTERHPEWGEFLLPEDSGVLVFRVPGSAGEVEIVFELQNPGSLVLAWEGGHRHFGFDWHLDPTVETVTREVVAEAELRLRGEGHESVIVPLLPIE